VVLLRSDLFLHTSLPIRAAGEARHTIMGMSRHGDHGRFSASSRTHAAMAASAPKRPQGRKASLRAHTVCEHHADNTARKGQTSKALLILPFISKEYGKADSISSDMKVVRSCRKTKGLEGFINISNGLSFSY
jgi:hypothetical protein